MNYRQGTSGLKVDSTWTAQTFTTPTNLCIGTTAKSASSAKLKGNLYGNIEIVGRAKFVPCERVSDNALGYYDTVGEAFYEQASGFSGAVSLGYDGSHYSFAVNGTPETLSVCGKNLFDKSKPYLNVFANATTNVISQGTTQWSFCVPCKPNTTYVLSGMIGGSSRWGSFTSNAIGSVATAFRSGNGTVTTGANDKWLIGLVYAQSSGGTTYDYRDTLQIEYGETASEYESYHEQTASVANLFSVGDVKDEQNIVSGDVARACDIKVLDGTEEWTTDTYGGYRRMVLQEVLNASGDTLSVICSHYASRSSDARQQPNSIFIAGSGKTVIYVDNTQNITTVDEFNAWLATQYANGTPVVIVYPLAEPTTEQVTAQHLTARDTATITAVTNNISDVTLEVQYWQKAE